ncbi:MULTISPECIES: tyrosine-type recombinase/integrase [Flavobacterium]|uniref:Site-specific integrase n=1 Tax=Flavobacterium keumense TaxID=1306518 RepID=A0ABY8N3B3_9FLAO|nr:MULTISPECIES: site-specific integrase [Flavobacterium]WGK93749.1 site-specific integrase [Flavobacterium keumense]
MATINFRVKSNSNPSPIYLRFKDKKIFDIETKTGLIINPIFWDIPKQKIRNVIDVPNRNEINEKLTLLPIHLINMYNQSYSSGEVISKNWVDKVIGDFFNRPKLTEEGVIDETKIYFTSYAQDWLDNKAKKFKVSANKYMDDTTIAHYQQVLNNFKDFEGKNKVKLTDLSNDFLDRFSIYLSDVKSYAEKTTKRKIGRIKFFCQRAESENISINKNYKERIFVKEEELEYKQPYLNEAEINKIFKFDFSHDKLMENVRDNFIIGLWTGLRVSDFLTRLDVSNIDDGFINIKTMKTKTKVTIPIHSQVAEILKKRNGNLPSKISEQKFNDKIKIIAQLCDIDEEMIGGVVKVDKKTKIKRKVIGTYKKWELVTSHICRRSFATNLFGKVPNKTLLDVCGWANEEMLFNYNKQTKMESALVLKKHWEANS